MTDPIIKPMPNQPINYSLPAKLTRVNPIKPKTERQKRPKPDAWIDRLVKRLPNVRPDFVEDVKAMSREDLQRRALIGSDWQGSFARCVDGIKEIAFIPGGSFDGHRDPNALRRIVEALVKACPTTWEDTYRGRAK